MYLSCEELEKSHDNCDELSGKQISTTAIVGPSVYLPTRKDSLCYTRLISVALRTLILSHLKIETIIAVGCWGALWRVHRSPPPKQQSDLGGCIRQSNDFEGWQMELSWHITVSSYLPTVLSLWERKKEGMDERWWRIKKTVDRKPSERALRR